MELDRTLRCVVCGTDVGPGLSVCPACSEPRVRICKCTALVTLDQRSCPACERVLPRVVSLEIRAKRRLKKRLVIAAVTLVVLGGAAVVAWPRLVEARRLAQILAEAESAIREGRFSDAAHQLGTYVADRPLDARAQALLAEASFATGEDSAGLAAAERAFLIDPESPGTHLVLARHYERTGDLSQAILHGSAAPEPGARAILGRTYAALGRLVESAREYDLAVAASPADAALLLDAARTHGLLGDADWARADEHRRRAAELVAWAAGLSGTKDADSAHALRLAEAEIALRAGKRGDVVRTLGPPPEGRVSADHRTRRMRLLVAVDAPEQAAVELRSALVRDPSNAGAFVATLRMLDDAGRAQDAVDTPDPGRVAGRAPTAEIHEALGDAAAAAGDPSIAERHYKSWARLAPRDPRPAAKSLALRIPGMLASARREAISTGETGHAKRPAELDLLDADDLRRLVWEAAWADLGARQPEAAAFVERLVELYPQDAEARALRIRRTFTAGGEGEAETMGAAMAADAGVTASDLRVFVGEAFDRGMVHLALDTAAPSLEHKLVDPGLVELVARCLLELGHPAAVRRVMDRSAPPDAHSSPEMRDVIGLLTDGGPVGDPGDPTSVDDFIAIARIESVRGRTDDVRTWFGKARAVSAAQPGSRRRLAEAMEDAGLFADAANVWDAVHLDQPEDADVVSRGAIARIMAAEGLQVVAQRIDWLGARPEAVVDAIAVRGLYAAVGPDATDAARGLADVCRVLAAERERTALTLAAARIELDAGDAEAAVRDARTVLRRRPWSVAARSLLMRALAGAAAADLEAGRVAAALDILEELDEMIFGSGDRRPRAPLADLVPPRLPSPVHELAQEMCTREPSRVGWRLVAALDLAARGRAEAAAALVDPASPGGDDAPGVPLVRALLRGRSGDVAADLAAAAGRGAPAGDVALLRAASAEAATPGASRAIVAEGLAASPEHARLRAASGSPEDLAWLLVHAPAEFDVLPDVHAAAAKLAASSDAATARRALRRAILVAPSASGFVASVDALRKLR